MNADNRDQSSPFGGFRPASSQPASGQSAQPFSAQQPAASYQPPTSQQGTSGQPSTSGHQPQRRPLSGQQPQQSAQASTSTPQRSSIRAAASGQQTTGQQVTGQQTTGAAAFAPTSGVSFPAAGSTSQTSAAQSTSASVATEDAPRKARVMVSRIDPRSALKIGFLLSVAAGVMLTVAVFVVWNLLNQMGFFALANEWVSKLFTEDQELNLMQFFHQGRVMSATILISVVNVFLLTALATIWAFLYNTVSSVVGGIYVTISDD